MILSCQHAMIEKKGTETTSNNADFQGGVIEKKHQTSVLIEMKKKEDFEHSASLSSSSKTLSTSQRGGKIGIIFMFIGMVVGLVLLFLIWRSIENLHQDFINGIIH